MSKGTKRASPGAEEEKNPLSNVELSDEDAKKLTQIQRDLARAELILGELVIMYEISLMLSSLFQSDKLRLTYVLCTRSAVRSPNRFLLFGLSL